MLTRGLPRNLLIFPLSRLELKTSVILRLLADIRCRQDDGNDNIVELGYRYKRVRHVLICLNFPDHFCCFGSFREVDEVGVLDQ